jgi:hypothetical protein
MPAAAELACSPIVFVQIEILEFACTLFQLCVGDEQICSFVALQKKKNYSFLGHRQTLAQTYSIQN